MNCTRRVRKGVPRVGVVPGVVRKTVYSLGELQVTWCYCSIIWETEEDSFPKDEVALHEPTN